MKSEFKGFSKVFGFTFKQYSGGKGYKNFTIVVAILCFLLPAIIMPTIEISRKNKNNSDSSVAEGGQLTETNIKQVFVVDNSSTDKVDLKLLNSIGNESFDSISYKSYDDIKKAQEAADKSDGYALLMAIDEKDGKYDISLIKPDETKLTDDDMDGYKKFINEGFPVVLVQKSGLSSQQLIELSTPVSIEEHLGGQQGEAERGGYAEAKKVMGMLLPYLNIMILYFMILCYGQEVSNSVIMEKTSKLMDTFLIAVKPWAMVMGKVLAIALAGITQLTVWVISLVASFTAGSFIVKGINPDTTMGIIKLFETFGDISGMFTIQEIILAILIILSGFLLYCSIAAIGGSMASKPEDLSSTNMLFTMAILISFFCTMYAGGLNGGMSSSEQWLNWFPLTAILVTPSRILVGQASLFTGFCSMILVLICSVLIVILSGKIYKMMALYKGNPPSIKKVFEMLRQKK